MKATDLMLGEAAEKFAHNYDMGTCDGYAQECFKAGAEWMAGQGEKDIWGRIEKYLSEQDPRNYATAGFILKNFEYFKQQIMEEEHPKF